MLQPVLTMIALQPALRSPGRSAVRSASLPDLLLRRAAALDLLLAIGDPRHEHAGRSSARDHQGVFPAHSAAARRPCWPGWSTSPSALPCSLLLLPLYGSARPPPCSRCPLFVALAVAAALGRRPWLSALQRPLPRRPLRRAVPVHVSDVRLAGRVSEQYGAGAVAMALRAQPDGRRHRRLPLGAGRTAPPDRCLLASITACGR